MADQDVAAHAFSAGRHQRLTERMSSGAAIEDDQRPSRRAELDARGVAAVANRARSRPGYRVASPEPYLHAASVNTSGATRLPIGAWCGAEPSGQIRQRGARPRLHRFCIADKMNEGRATGSLRLIVRQVSSRPACLCGFAIRLPGIRRKPSSKLPRRQFLRLAAGALVPVAPRIARAQTYPTRTITLIVPFPPGGSTDVAARIAADHMSRTLGQQIIVQNVSGAGGTTGSTRAMRDDPDGYTILMGQMGTHAAAVALYRTSPTSPMSTSSRSAWSRRFR